MENYLKAFVVMIAGLLLGFAVTAASLGAGHGLVAAHAGPWTAWPRNGTLEIDPYARAILAHSGETPLGRDQGMAFFASADSEGGPLDGRCEYRVVGPTPPTRLWTLGAFRPDGTLIDNPTKRYFFTSNDILRRDGGAFEIAISPEARPGNWLSAGGGPFVLALRLYDTPLDLDASLDASTFPKILKIGCA